MFPVATTQLLTAVTTCMASIGCVFHCPVEATVVAAFAWFAIQSTNVAWLGLQQHINPLHSWRGQFAAACPLQLCSTMATYYFLHSPLPFQSLPPLFSPSPHLSCMAYTQQVLVVWSAECETWSAGCSAQCVLSGHNAQGTERNKHQSVKTIQSQKRNNEIPKFGRV